VPKDIVIEAAKRDDKGKNASRRLRRSGRIPAVLYGGDGAVVPLAVDPRSVFAVLHSEAGENTLLGLKVDKGMVPGRVMIREHQLDPVTEDLLHADFVRIAMDRAIRVQVAIHTLGIAKGVKLQGGILDHPLREVEVECLPADIPERLEVDISELEMGKSYRVSDLVAPRGVKILTDPGMAFISVVAPTVEKVEAPPAEGAAVAEAPTEPEVIKKGKAETAEGAEAAPEKEGKEGRGEKKGGDRGGKSEKK